MKSAIGNLQVRDVTLNNDYTITVTPCYTFIYMRHVAAGCKSFEICSRMPRECYWHALRWLSSHGHHDSLCPGPQIVSRC